MNPVNPLTLIDHDTEQIPINQEVISALQIQYIDLENSRFDIEKIRLITNVSLTIEFF